MPSHGFVFSLVHCRHPAGSAAEQTTLATAPQQAPTSSGAPAMPFSPVKVVEEHTARFHLLLTHARRGCMQEAQRRHSGQRASRASESAPGLHSRRGDSPARSPHHGERTAMEASMCRCGPHQQLATGEQRVSNHKPDHTKQPNTTVAERRAASPVSDDGRETLRCHLDG